MQLAWAGSLLVLLLALAIPAAQSSWWNIAFLAWSDNVRMDQLMILSAQPTCSNIAGLSQKQTVFCQNHFSLMPAVTHGTRLAMQECRKQFQMRKWNCIGQSNNIAFGPTAGNATRESSFAYAVSAAGVVHAISRACKRAASDNAQGWASQLQHCGCSKALRPRSLSEEFKWGGCGDDIMFGYEFARGFIDAKEIERNHPRFSNQLAVAMINLHNNEVGRQAVFRLAQVGCKCHGVSGACSLRTCWQQLRPFHQIGSKLRAMYDSAVRVRLSKKGTDIRRRSKRRPRKPSKAELVYLHSSPNYCNPEPQLGIKGTRGRQCQLNSQDPLSDCRILCCNRGYTTKTIYEDHRCNCKFHWCCKVECDVCKVLKEVYICN